MVTKRVICLVGESGAGKGTVADILKEHGYIYSSLSDQVRVLAGERRIHSPARGQLQLLANETRSQYGADYFARRLLADSRFVTAEKLVVDGARNPLELTAIRDSLKFSDKFTICAIRADRDVRYQRILARRKDSDPLDYEEFVRCDIREMGHENEPNGQQNWKCLEMAHVTINNNFSDIYSLRLEFRKAFNGREDLLDMQENGLGLFAKK